MCKYSDGRWECPHENLPYSEYCIFHLKDDNKDIKEFNKGINEILKTDEEFINFSGFYFPPETAYFRLKQIRKNIVFDWAQFSGNVSFIGVKFSKDASFDWATFLNGGNFANAEFSGKASFKGTKFLEGGHFQFSKFSGDANFQGAKFSKDAFFLGGSFQEMQILK